MKNYCMYFTNEEIVEFLVNPLRKYKFLDVRMFTDEEEEITGENEKKLNMLHLMVKYQHRILLYISMRCMRLCICLQRKYLGCD